MPKHCRVKTNEFQICLSLVAEADSWAPWTYFTAALWYQRATPEAEMSLLCWWIHKIFWERCAWPSDTRDHVRCVLDDLYEWIVLPVIFQMSFVFMFRGVITNAWNKSCIWNRDYYGLQHGFGSCTHQIFIWVIVFPKFFNVYIVRALK